MLQFYKTTDSGLAVLEAPEKGCWIDLSKPTREEIARVQELMQTEPDFLTAALDEEERARIESEDGNTLIIVDIPIVEAEGASFLYTTIPLGIVFSEDYICTVCLRETPLTADFIGGKVKGFFTFKKTRFILQLLYRNSTRFLQYLKQIDKTSTRIQNDLQRSMKNKELIQLLSLEKSLVYFSTALTSNEMVLDKMMKLDYVKKYQDDTDLLEDVIIENRQAIEMCNIYRDILSGTMDAFASVISNNLNIVMKLLTAITIVLSIPTVIASLWGMNVNVPFAGSSSGFWIVLAITAGLTLLVTFIMRKKHMF